MPSLTKTVSSSLSKFFLRKINKFRIYNQALFFLKMVHEV